MLLNGSNHRFSAFAIVGILCVLLPVASLTSEVPRPRGVALSKAPLYLPTGADRGQFVCLDGLKTIRFEQVVIADVINLSKYN